MAHAVSAKTTYPNTPESDRMPQVMHTVTMSDGRAVNVMAADPIDAINKANSTKAVASRR